MKKIIFLFLFFISASYAEYIDRSSLLIDPLPTKTENKSDSTMETSYTNRSSLLIEPINIKKIKIKKPHPYPGSTLANPSAFGSSRRYAFVGFSYLSDSPEGKDIYQSNALNADGSFVAGIGLGNPDKIGFDLIFGLLDINEPQNAVQLGFKLHHRFSKDTAVALAWSNALRLGQKAVRLSHENIYGVISHRVYLRPNKTNQLPLTISLGVGSGAFRPTDDIAADKSTAGIFFSAGLRVLPRLSLNTSIIRDQINAGFSVVPFNKPLVVTIGMVDLTNRNKKGERFLVNVGYSFKF